MTDKEIDLMNSQIMLELLNKRTNEAFFEGHSSANLAIKRYVKTLITQEEEELKEYSQYHEEYYCIKARINALKLVDDFINAPDDDEML